MKNLAIMQMKKDNAAKLDQKFGKQGQIEQPQRVTGLRDFPQYEDYESMPGKGGKIG
jgi:NADH dehydrogenase [ubiquinone] 1 alpha subcomplex assembly factor 2